MTAPLHCDFCYRPVASTLRRQRRAVLDVLVWRPAPTTYVCELHVGKGLDHVRSWRVRQAAARALSGLGYLVGAVFTIVIGLFCALVGLVTVALVALSGGRLTGKAASRAR